MKITDNMNTILFYLLDINCYVSLWPRTWPVSWLRVQIKCFTWFIKKFYKEEKKHFIRNLIWLKCIAQKSKTCKLLVLIRYLNSNIVCCFKFSNRIANISCSHDLILNVKIFQRASSLILRKNFANKTLSGT